MVRAFAAGVALWFFGALYFGVLVEAALPHRATYLRDMASAAFFPMALIGTLVLARQGLLASTLRFIAALAAGGLLWFPLAALAGSWLMASIPEQQAREFLPTLNLLVLIGSFGISWWLTRWLPLPSGNGQEGDEAEVNTPPPSRRVGS